MDFKAEFVKHHLLEGFKKTFAEQRKRAEAIYSTPGFSHGYPRQRSGRLRKALESPDYIVNAVSSGAQAIANYPLYIRFLDMRRMGNRKIYNRPVWGIFYKQTLRDMRYEFADWLEKATKETLAAAAQPAI